LGTARGSAPTTGSITATTLGGVNSVELGRFVWGVGTLVIVVLLGAAARRAMRTEGGALALTAVAMVLALVLIGLVTLFDLPTPDKVILR
jgi:hypothetical protein